MGGRSWLDNADNRSVKREHTEMMLMQVEDKTRSVFTTRHRTVQAGANSRVTALINFIAT